VTDVEALREAIQKAVDLGRQAIAIGLEHERTIARLETKLRKIRAVAEAHDTIDGIPRHARAAILLYASPNYSEGD
jgi:hypothetical protein